MRTLLERVLYLVVSDQQLSRGMGPGYGRSALHRTYGFLRRCVLKILVLADWEALEENSHRLTSLPS